MKPITPDDGVDAALSRLSEIFHRIPDVDRFLIAHDALLAAANAALLDGSLSTLPDHHFQAFVAAIAKAEELAS